MIPFPRIHIAQSVLNRIMNTLEDKQSPLNLMPTPIPPDPTALGLQINEQTSMPMPEVGLPDMESQEDVAAVDSLTGGSLFDGALL